MKKKYLKYSKLFEINIPVWNQRVTVTYGSDRDFFLKSLDDQDPECLEKCKELKKKIKDIWKHHRHCNGMYCWHDNLKMPYIHIFESDDILKLISTVTHEALHATFGILDYVGVEYSEASEESYTYFQQYLLTEILKQIFEIENNK